MKNFKIHLIYWLLLIIDANVKTLFLARIPFANP